MTLFDLNTSAKSPANFFLLISVLAAVSAPCSWAQADLQPSAIARQRMDLRDLGYRFYDQIPGDGGFVTSLTVAGDGQIYGATSGVQSYLFVFSTVTNRAQPLGMIADAKGVYHSLVSDSAGVVYIGTGRNVLAPFAIKPGLSSGLNHISRDIWTQVEEQYAGYGGGHIYSYGPAAPRRIRPGGEAAAEADLGKLDQAATLTDLGVPVPGDGIYCMTLDKERGILYGLTYPRGHLFAYDLKLRRGVDKGSIFEEVLFGDPVERTLRTLPRDLVVSASGEVYTSTGLGHLLCFDPAQQQLRTLPAIIPGEGMQVVDAWARDGEVLYGGTSEGFVFRFSPASGRVYNLGKPMVSQRIRGLTLGKDHILYGIAGDRATANMFFRYDAKEGRFETLGGIAVNRSPYYMWNGEQFDAMTTGLDGTIYMGESDRGGHLFFYIP